MKAAYIVFLTQPITGIQKSLRDKAKALASCSIDIDVIVINPRLEKRCGNFCHVKVKTALPMKLEKIEYVFCRYRLISKSVDLSVYDIVILRYPCADRSGIRFCEKHKIITEHHSDVRSQFLADMRASGSIVLKASKLVRYFLEKRYGHIILENCRGMMALTDEIKKIECTRFATGTKGITVTNGIDVSAVSKTGYRVYDESGLDIIFIASSQNPWHGLDRLTTSLNTHRGKPRITLHVVGNIPDNQFRISSTANARIRFYGKQTGQELDRIFAGSHVAFSTLGLYRKNMSEACSLKTREYTARGIPFVLGYTDPDLEAVDPEQRFFLHVRNDGSAIHIGAVIQFVKKMSEGDNPRTIPEYMRRYAYTHMDWRVKVQRYVEICSEVGRGKTNK